MLFFRDRIRSTSSVVSHTFCTAVVWSLCRKDLEEIDENHKQTDTNDLVLEIEDSEEKITANGKLLYDYDGNLAIKDR